MIPRPRLGWRKWQPSRIAGPARRGRPRGRRGRAAHRGRGTDQAEGMDRGEADRRVAVVEAADQGRDGRRGVRPEAAEDFGGAAANARIGARQVFEGAGEELRPEVIRLGLDPSDGFGGSVADHPFLVLDRAAEVDEGRLGVEAVDPSRQAAARRTSGARSPRDRTRMGTAGRAPGRWGRDSQTIRRTNGFGSDRAS